ncbi:MAG TPA: YihY/virulence factor BrkB family protein, partial [Solirubrobacteraceae bacterium]|nr:YihY/virulence factor BrkB family protein [Solirubrobacteraceae bacterium]
LDALRAVRASQSAAGPTFVVALVIALWSASAYVGAFIPAANVVWEAPEERPFLRKLAVRIALTLTLLLLIAITALTVVLTGPIAEQIGAVVGLGAVAVDAWQYAKWPFLAVAVMALLTILYWASPNVRHPGWSWLTPGSVLAVGLWIAASLAFTFYVNNLSNYNDVYGTIGGVLVFLLWLWLTNIAILLGAELNAEIERTRAIEAGMRPEDKTPYLPLRNG